MYVGVFMFLLTVIASTASTLICLFYLGLDSCVSDDDDDDDSDDYDATACSFFISL